MDPVEISQIAQVAAPSRPSPVVHSPVHKGGGFPQRSLSSSRMEVIPERSDTPNRESYEQEKTGADSAESSTLSDEEESKQRSAESSGTATSKSLRRTSSSRDMQAASSSSRLATLVANVGEEELQGFANQFRVLVDRVSRELEESRISENNSRESHTPPLHHVLDTHTPYMTIDEFGREVTTEEPIAILGGVIKRMPTIESVGSREVASLRSATLVSGGAGAASLAPSSSASSRPPTGATMASFNDAASASLASASQPSSRSNSIHRLRTPSELGELVRDALRARAQARPLPPSPSARPGSGGSVSGSGSGCTGAGGGSGSGSGSGSGEAVGPGPSASSRSRSNSLGPNEVLPPVTEQGELGRENSDLPRRRPPRRLGGDVPGAAGGMVGASEMGELLRTEVSRSWASSSQSATSTAYFTAGTSGSLAVSGSGSGAGGGAGGDTGTGNSSSAG